MSGMAVVMISSVVAYFHFLKRTNWAYKITILSVSPFPFRVLRQLIDWF